MADIFYFYNTYIRPGVDNYYDIGSSDYEFKDLYLDGIAYLDFVYMDGNIDCNANNIIDIGQLQGFNSVLYIDMTTDGIINFHTTGGGAPFTTPNLDFDGAGHFDNHLGFATDKQIQFRDDAIYINSADDGHLDFTCDSEFDLNTSTTLNLGTNYSITWSSDLEIIDLNGSSNPTRIRIDGTFGYIDVMQNQVLQLVLENRTDDPASPVPGQIWFRVDV